MGCAQSTVKKPEETSMVSGVDMKDATGSSTTRYTQIDKNNVQNHTEVTENGVTVTATTDNANSTMPISSIYENGPAVHMESGKENAEKHNQHQEELISQQDELINGKDALIAVHSFDEEKNVNVNNNEEHVNVIYNSDELIAENDLLEPCVNEPKEPNDLKEEVTEKLHEVKHEFETNDTLNFEGNYTSVMNSDEENNRNEKEAHLDGKTHINGRAQAHAQGSPTSSSSLSELDIIEENDEVNGTLGQTDKDEHLKWNDALAYKGVGTASQLNGKHHTIQNKPITSHKEHNHNRDAQESVDDAKVNGYVKHYDNDNNDNAIDDDNADDNFDNLNYKGEFSESQDEWYGEQLYEKDLEMFKVTRSLSMPSSLSSSIPQLFRLPHLSESNLKREEGSWEWWYNQVRRQRVTHDRHRKEMLLNIHNHLTRQHENTPQNVELDLSELYMERGGPYMLAKFLTSVRLPELRWITLLRLDGNYFTERGFGSLLATLSHSNETNKSGPLFPVLRQLYLNNMNLTHNDIGGIMFYLFPVDAAALACARQPQPTNHKNTTPTTTATITTTTTYTNVNGNKNSNVIINHNDNLVTVNATDGGQFRQIRRNVGSELDRINGSRAGPPSENYLTQLPMLPHMQLFPALSILSLSDNTMLGDSGLAELLRYMLAPHFDHHTLHILDLSRCGLTTNAITMLSQYEHKVGKALRHKAKIVHVTTMALLGNFSAHDLEQNLRRSSRVQIKFICESRRSLTKNN